MSLFGARTNGTGIGDAQLDPGLYQLVKDPAARRELRKVLINSYFGENLRSRLAALSAEEPSTQMSLTQDARTLAPHLERIFTEFRQTAPGTPWGSDHPLWNSFKAAAAAIEQLPPLQKRSRRLKVEPSGGQGRKARVPWIALMDTRETRSTQRGVYCVYLFREDMTGVYLALAQGVTAPRRQYSQSEFEGFLAERVGVLRSFAAEATTHGFRLDGGIELRASEQLGKDYELSTAAYKFYDASALPDDEQFARDLDVILDAYDRYLDSRTASDGPVDEKRPLHLVLKWSAANERDTIALHKRIADERGSVWWGKSASKSVSRPGDATVRRLREQIQAGTRTHLYLHGAGQTWRTELLDITKDATEVDASLVPSYYTVESCDLFVRLRKFEQLSSDWPRRHLVLASAPNEPERIPGALANQTPVAVYETDVEDAGSPAAPQVPETVVAPTKEPRTIDWLVEQTLWTRDELEELVHAIRADWYQSVLAGPPGTGKTWVAQRLAEYITQGETQVFRTVQFHPSYSYEEFVEGLRPVSREGTITFEAVPGVVLRLVDNIGAAPGPHILLIDELNRANLPKVLGELMYLFEYRDQRLDLRFRQQFSLPGSLRFIGTMNTADRSIRSIDTALRRRFQFVECPPRRDILERYYENGGNEVPGLFGGFERLNESLRELRDRYHTIGHTYFMRKPYTWDRLNSVWQHQLAPLIEEYFFDQPDLAEKFSVAAFWPRT